MAWRGQGEGCRLHLRGTGGQLDPVLSWGHVVHRLQPGTAAQAMTSGLQAVAMQSMGEHALQCTAQWPPWCK
jgi:hypothetical protein